MREYYRDYITAFLIVFSPALIYFPYIAYQKATENIYEAASHGNIKRFVYLIRNNENEITQDTLRTSFGNAIRHGQPEIVEYVLKNNLLKTISMPKSFNSALKSQNKKTIKLILDLGIEKDKISQGLFSVIKNYHSHKDRSKSRDLIDLLISNGADKNVVGVRGKIPLNSAITQGDYDAFNSFLRHGFDVNKKGSKGKTPAHNAIKSKSDTTYLKILIEKGADLTLEDNEGNNAIHQCYTNQNCSKMLDVLVEFKQDIKILNRSGQNLLHLCGKHENYKTIEKLMNLGFDINQKDYNGNTPLHHASSWTKYDDSLSADLEPDSLEKLLEYNTDATLKNDQNKTALDIAKATGEDQTIQLLTDYLNQKKHD